MCSIGLLLSTRKGQLPFDSEYGSVLWDREYADIQTSNKSELRSGLRDAIQKYEKRLSSVVVSFEAPTETGQRGFGVAVKVTGEYSDNGSLRPFEAVYQLG